MPVSFAELLQDLPQAGLLIQQLQANIAAMPPAATRTAVDYAICAGAAADGPLMKVAQLIDILEAQAKTTP